METVMDTVTLDGKVYLKASKAADTAGYTADYVGQLCRKGAIEAVVLGKTWYVLEKSLLAHKQSQTRTNTAVLRRDIGRQKEVLEAERRYGYAPHTLESAYRKHLETAIRYSQDDESLLPPLEKGSSHPDISALEGEIMAHSGAVSSDEAAIDGSDDINEKDLAISGTEASEDEHTGEDYEGAQDVPGEYVKEEERGETQIPIRKIPQEREREVSYESSARMVSVKSDGEVYDERKDRDTDDAKGVRVDTQKSPKRRLRAPLLLPMLSALALLFALGTIFLEGTWNYQDRGTGKISFGNEYQISSTSSVIDAFRQVAFPER